MAAMGAGDLDQRIQIQIATTARNQLNEPVETWVPHATVFAKKHDVSAREAFRAREVGAELSTRFTIRYSPDVAAVDARYRIVHEDPVTRATTYYNIIGARNIGRARWREIDTVARSEGE